MIGRSLPVQLGLAAACVAAFLAVAFSGRGVDTRPIAPPTTAPIWLNRVTAADLGRTPAGSPARALLEWFRAVQRRDLRAVKSLTASPAVTHVATPTLNQAVARIGLGLAHPQVISTRIQAGQALVRVRLVTYLPNGTRPISVVARTFPLWRRGGSWVLSNVSVLLQGRSPT